MPRKLNRELPGHDARIVTEMGWSGIKNGPLLRRAAKEFEAFLTVDQGFKYQQNLHALDLVIFVMVANSNDIGDLHPLMPKVREAREKASTGEVVSVQI